MDRRSLKDKRVVIYARYSSELQHDTSIEDQEARCRAFIDSRGGDGRAARLLSDRALSGTSVQRPSLDELLRLARSKAVDVIVTEDLSRVSRNLADSARIFNELEYVGVVLLGVSDGIDTSAQGSKISFAMRALMNDEYVAQLKDKTLRGLEGQFRRGYSTGGLPLGYRSEPVLDGEQKVLGHRVLIDEPKAAIVRRIFELYRSGYSYALIAKTLHQDGVAPPRRWKKRKPGWTPETVRAILYNRYYLGEATFKVKQWRRVPGGVQRRPVRRPDEQVLSAHHPERQIIAQQLWDEVHERLAAVRRCYTKAPDGSPKGRIQTGKKNSYLLSGLLHCGVCGGSMTIHAGTSAAYYRCAAQKKRGTCANSLALREDVARKRVLQVILGRLQSSEAVDEMRKRVALRLGELTRASNHELAERRERLARTEQKIAALIDYLAQGQRSEYVQKSLADLEAHAKADKEAIAALLEQAALPVELPPPSFFLKRSLELAELFSSDPLRGREVLQRFFVDGQLLVYPQLDGYYVAEGQFTPLTALRLPFGQPASADKTPTAPHEQGRRKDVWSKVSCAGRI